MAGDVVQCSRCGQETPAGSVYCEKCGAYLGGGAHAVSAQVESSPRRGWPVFDMPLSWDDGPSRDKTKETSEFPSESAFEHEAFGMPEHASEAAVFNTSEVALSSAQLIAPPQFADVLVSDGAQLDFGDEGDSVLERDQGNDWGALEEPASSFAADAPFEDWDGFTGPATRGVLPSSLSSIRQDEDEYPPVDPVSAPFQPRLGIFRVIIVIVIAVLFGAAIVLLSCLAVMRLLGF